LRVPFFFDLFDFFELLPRLFLPFPPLTDDKLDEGLDAVEGAAAAAGFMDGKRLLIPSKKPVKPPVLFLSDVGALGTIEELMTIYVI
jgi:hypothetical protein